MSKIMKIIEENTDGKSYQTFKHSYDFGGIPSIEYEEFSKVQWNKSAETDRHDDYIDLKKFADTLLKNNDEPILKFFLDGSRRIYKVDDIAYNRQVFPVIAGQIGVGCCRRIKGKMKKEKFYRELVIALPDKSNPDLWFDQQRFDSLTDIVNSSDELKSLGIKFSKILKYSTKDNSSEIFENLAIAAVQDYMIEAEKRMVIELVRENKLGQNAYLLKDGSLEYKEMKKGSEDLRNLQKIKHNYNWVVGVSKSFNPEICKDYKGRPNSNYIADLPLFHRTPVARYKNEFSGDVQFGVWYIRLRDKLKTQTPFDGVVKVEKILMDEELENGIDSDVVDLISANIVNERTPVCYGMDSRWANHLYPVYLTESFIKSKYISTETFLHLF